MIALSTVAFLLALTADAVEAKTYKVDGGEIRVCLVPDWTAAMVGEPFYLSLVIENLTSRDLHYHDGHTTNGLGRPDFITLTTVGNDGKALEVPDAGPSFGGITGPRLLKPGERHAKRLFFPNWARISKPGKYTLTCQWKLVLYAPPRASQSPR